ncbi:GNAT family N-acetyltransferase [Saccharibacillus sp. O23]|uniref:GNAT family N-acetyltransferase n=1 Tax=Saccharibacillus sp. O23 TaxID=2009338 RepID=UPI000B4DF563|nr:GNAT family N-acetyltransferase [Saccharibacillus sp. O23]OWR32584.1 GNAT family N-acetyltransferase [Saccharibacillus sp. O23]
MQAFINLPLKSHEVPRLREAVGWDGRESDYPALFERCNFWAGARNEQGKLIAFGYVAGMGLQHGYMEDIIVHPDYQSQGIGERLVRKLLEEAQAYGLEIVTLTFAERHASFYERCGFHVGSGGVWQKT